MLFEPTHHLGRSPDLDGFARSRSRCPLYASQHFEGYAVARALTAMTGTGTTTFAHQLHEWIAHPLAGDLDEPKLGHRRNLCRGVILGKTLGQRIQHSFNVRRFAQMDEIDDNQAPHPS